KNAYDKNINEFEEVCKDLDFTLAIYDRNKKEIENKRIMEDINVLNKIMYDANGDSLIEQMKEIAQLSEKFDQLMKRTTSIDFTLIKAYKDRVPEINPKELASVSPVNDGKNIFKRTYRGIGITENYEPKIANFRLSRTEQEVSVNIENILSIIRWLAPEKLSQSQYDFNIKYDHKFLECCHQRIPYENINSVPKIEQLVKCKKREKIMLDPSPIAQELFKIIKQ
ncbi:1893_t:CDS:2, partial [Gigaspora rosea]